MEKQAAMQTLKAICSTGAGKGDKVDRSEVPLPVSNATAAAHGQADASSSQNQAGSGLAPLDLTMEFVTTLMSRDYEPALLLCKQIMEYEPRNKVAAEFFPLLLKKNLEAIAKGSKKSRDSDDDSDSTSDSSTGSTLSTSAATSCESSACSCLTSTACTCSDDSSADSNLSDIDSDEEEDDSDKERADFAYKVHMAKTTKL